MRAGAKWCANLRCRRRYVARVEYNDVVGRANALFERDGVLGLLFGVFLTVYRRM